MQKILELFGILVLLGFGAVSCGSDTNPLILNVGAIAPSTTAANIMTDASGQCSTGICDGNFGSVLTRGTEQDLEAITQMLITPYAEAPYFWPGDVRGNPEFQTFVGDNIPPGEFRTATWRLIMTIPCTDGVLELVVLYTGSVDDSGGLEAGSGESTTNIRTYRNCLLTGDILDNGVGDESILLNGTERFTYGVPGVPADGDPYRYERIGRVYMSSDLNGDDTFGNEIWGEVIDFNAEYEFVSDGSMPYNGQNWFANGGVCVGANVLLGADNFDDSDDGCATDADALPEGFSPAGACETLDC